VTPNIKLSGKTKVLNQRLVLSVEQRSLIEEEDAVFDNEEDQDDWN
tara:strand:- start:154 stop:291 length:138 start_codon:yes stop_codon:yes gene_type:complete